VKASSSEERVGADQLQHGGDDDAARADAVFELLEMRCFLDPPLRAIERDDEGGL